jgi:hypothetical protein
LIFILNDQRYNASLPRPATLHAIMVTARLCHDTNGGLVLEGMIVSTERIFTLHHDDVLYAVWESPDSEWTLKQAK